ncbi:hypothetical protein ACFWSF_30795 [Streptomyces sp. NPDC058611]|uniref:hypothetical protein n=1 Tax=unclassified Streptomyces TaxID=2593676 RepID=UPI0036606050
MAAATCEQVDHRDRRNVTKPPFAHLRVCFFVFGVLPIYDTGQNLKKVEPAFGMAECLVDAVRAVLARAGPSCCRLFEGRPYPSVPLMCQQGSVL